MPDAPTLIAPPGACDCHMHVFEDRFLAQGDTRTRPPEASARMYREVQARLRLQRVVFVQSNVYGSDNRGMLEAMATYGRRQLGA